MLQPPHVDGLPLWLQVVATLAFGVATLAVGLSGYFKREKSKNESDHNVQLSGASIADMGAVRHLADVCIQLSANMLGMERAIQDQTYYDRERNELLREACLRMRDIRERLDKLPG